MRPSREPRGPEVDVWCPGALASRVQVRPEGQLFRVEVAVTVRLSLQEGAAPVAPDHQLESALHVTMAELGNWPLGEEAFKREDGTRVSLPKVDARLRVHRREGAREPLQDVPLDVERLAIDRSGTVADAALRAQFVVSDDVARLVGVVGIAVGKGGIGWPSRDQVIAELALAGELHATYPREPSAEPVTLDDAAAISDDASPPLPELLIPPLPIPRPPPSKRPATKKPATKPPPAPRRKRSEAPPPPKRHRKEAPVAEPTLDGNTLTEVSSSQRRALLIHNETPLAVWTVPWRLRGKHSLTVVIKASCDLAPGGPAGPRPEADAPCGDRYLEDDPAATLLYPSDHALLKHRVDVILNGRCHAPNGRAGQGEVTFRFGSAGNQFERRVAVFGPREWRNDAPSAPQVFRSIPLVYERAFGGPDFARNPLGVGHGTSHRGSFVPSLEDPEQLLGCRGEERRPVCFAPVAPSWEARWSRVGKSWRGRLEENWHDLPDDFDWEHFQSAPRPQQLDYLTGDEAFEITGASPHGAIVRGRLPGLKPHCRVQAEAGERPVQVSLDTVVIDTEAQTMQLVWRGLISVSAMHAPELRALTVTL